MVSLQMKVELIELSELNVLKVCFTDQNLLLLCLAASAYGTTKSLRTFSKYLRSVEE